MIKFSSINNKKIFNNFINKSYVEGVYNDSILNKKLGRVGMSYKEYAKLVGNKPKKTISNKEKHLIPENLSDLTFKKENNRDTAEYSVGDLDVKITLLSYTKYGDKKFLLNIKNSKGEETSLKDLNTTDLLRKMRMIKNGQSLIKNEPMYKDIPLTPEELDKKYGNIGFNHLYVKDDLDIKVWLREGYDKKNPTFNIYVKNVKTNKTRNYTKLSLLATHNKLLEFDLNPNIDRPLSPFQLAEKERILKEEKYNFNDDDNNLNNSDISPIIRSRKLIKKNSSGKDIIDSKILYLNGNRVNITLPMSEDSNGLLINFNNNKNIYNNELNKTIDINITREDDNEYHPIREKLISVKSIKELSNLLNEINNKGKEYDLHDKKNDISPSKNIGIDFNKNGTASFEKGDFGVKIIVDKDDRSKLDVISYKKNKEFNSWEVDGMESLDVDNFKNEIENLDLGDIINEKNKINEITTQYWQKYRDNKEPKDIIENYSYGNSLLNIPGIKEYTWNKEEALKNKNVEKILKDKKLNGRYSNFNEEKIDAIAFVKSKEVDKWLNTLPNSNKYSKNEIIKKINDRVDRLNYNSGNLDMFGAQGVRSFIVKNMY